GHGQDRERDADRDRGIRIEIDAPARRRRIRFCRRGEYELGGSVGADRHIVIVRVMTDVSGEPPVDVSSARPSDVLVSVRSALVIMSVLGLPVLMLEIALNSKRVIAWVLVAGALAALLYPAVEFGSRWMARGIVVLLLVIAALSSIGFVGYRIANDVSKATDSLQRAAPERAAELE